MRSMSGWENRHTALLMIYHILSLIPYTSKHTRITCRLLDEQKNELKYPYRVFIINIFEKARGEGDREVLAIYKIIHSKVDAIYRNKIDSMPRRIWHVHPYSTCPIYFYIYVTCPEPLIRFPYRTTRMIVLLLLMWEILQCCGHCRP